MSVALRTALIGFGKMGYGYARDPVMARHYRYAAHSQVLTDHPRFDWCAAVDPDLAARDLAAETYGVPTAIEVADLPKAAEIEVAVIATPPQSRMGIVERLPGLKAVVLEKPLGTTLQAAEEFLAACERRGIVVTVNLWRRADRLFRDLAAGHLGELIGTPQTVTCLYGNGLLNNGTHMLDFVRMLFGEIERFQLLGAQRGFSEGPIAGDTNPPFALELRSGLTVAFTPLRFAHYRENGFIAWGSEGRLDVLAEGLSVSHFPHVENRAMQGEREIASDRPRSLASTAGHALYDLYDNLAAALEGREQICSSAASALETTAWIDRIREADLQRKAA